jgi:hypothetical protein
MFCPYIVCPTEEKELITLSIFFKKFIAKMRSNPKTRKISFFIYYILVDFERNFVQLVSLDIMLCLQWLLGSE